MNFKAFDLQRHLVGVAAVVMLNACTTTGSLQSPAAGAAALLPPGQAAENFVRSEAKTKPLLFVAVPQNNAVDILSQAKKHKMVGQITGLNNPTGLASDSVGDLYVANYNTSAVSVYAPPYTGAPTRSLSTPDYNPYNVAVSRTGLVAVATSCAGSCPSFYAVSFYAKGSSTPCVTLPSASSPNVPYAVAFDRGGDLFVVGQDGEGPYIGEITGGCAATTVTPLTAGNTLHRLFDVHLNNDDQIAILDDDAGYIYTYNLPNNGSLGNPVYSLNLGAPEKGFNFAFLASGRDLYANLNLAGVTEFDYPSGPQGKTIDIDGAGYAAVTPPLIP
jgi:hypothetical protein